MFFESLGKLFFQKMRPLFFFVLLSAAPLASLLFLSLEMSRLDDLEERLSFAFRKEARVSSRVRLKKEFFDAYAKANPCFLEETVEPLQLLEKERQKIGLIQKHPALIQSEEIQKRSRFLEKNRLIFREEKRLIQETMKEIEGRLLYPVQLDEEDLKKFLSMMENVSIEDHSSLWHRNNVKDQELDKEAPLNGCPERETLALVQGASVNNSSKTNSMQSKTDSSIGIHPPQIVISSFELKKVITELETEVFEMNVDFVKREFL